MKSKPRPENSIVFKLFAPSAWAAASSAALAFWACAGMDHSIATAIVANKLLFIIAPIRSSILSPMRKLYRRKKQDAIHYLADEAHPFIHDSCCPARVRREFPR